MCQIFNHLCSSSNTRRRKLGGSSEQPGPFPRRLTQSRLQTQGWDLATRQQQSPGRRGAGRSKKLQVKAAAVIRRRGRMSNAPRDQSGTNDHRRSSFSSSRILLPCPAPSPINHITLRLKATRYTGADSERNEGRWKADRMWSGAVVRELSGTAGAYIDCFCFCIIAIKVCKQAYGSVSQMSPMQGCKAVLMDPYTFPCPEGKDSNNPRHSNCEAVILLIKSCFLLTCSTSTKIRQKDVRLNWIFVIKTDLNILKLYCLSSGRYKKDGWKTII